MIITIDTNKIEYKGFVIEEGLDAWDYYLVHKADNRKQTLWEDATIQKCKNWIDANQ